MYEVIIKKHHSILFFRDFCQIWNRYLNLSYNLCVNIDAITKILGKVKGFEAIRSPIKKVTGKISVFHCLLGLVFIHTYIHTWINTITPIFPKVVGTAHETLKLRLRAIAT